jgi:hypothetical protein
MAFDAIPFFYDGQVRRFLLQVVRAFSGFQIEAGKNADGTPRYQVVPCRMASQNKQVASIIQNNSENSLLSTPMITVFIKDMAIDRSRTQNPGHISTLHVHELAVDPTTGKYTSDPGAKYTVDRMMPHPMDMTLQVDIWTSNENQKHMLFEQIVMAFNVGFDIQNSDNPLDWSAMTTMTLDSIAWSSRSMPVGTSDEIDIMTFIFKLPLWISPPAKVTQQRVIEQIVTNIYAGTVDATNSEDTMVVSSDAEQVGRVIVTPGDYHISVDGGEVTLLGPENAPVPSWERLLYQYGTVTPAQSQLRLRADIEQADDLDIVGTIQLDSSRPNVLFWQIDIDTLPANTQPPVNGLIDPLVHIPGVQLPAATLGQRYLVLEDIGPCEAWGNLTAYANDIIEYTMTGWTVSFSANTTHTSEYLVNLRTSKQLRFLNGSWIMAISGEYNPGFWRIHL